MNIVASKENLLKGINIVSKAVANLTTMSILECILIETQGQDKIKLTANNYEMGIETTIDGTINKQEGKIALDAKILAEIIRKFPESDVTIEVTKNLVTVISCEKSIFKISGRSGDDFTALPKIEKNDSLLISQFALKEMIRQTIFSVSHDKNFPVMTGLFLEVNKDILKLSAIDGFRGSIRKTTLKNSYNDTKVIIPGKTLNEISKILPGDSDKDVAIYFSEKNIIFEFDETLVISRLIEGEYFRVDLMISNDYETKISVNKKEIYNIMDRALLLVKENEKKPIIFTISDDTMELKLISSIGNMNDEIGIEKVGQDMMIAFNPKYYLEALRVIDDEIVDVYFVNAKSPCFIRDKNDEYIYFILPVNFVNI